MRKAFTIGICAMAMTTLVVAASQGDEKERAARSSDSFLEDYIVVRLAERAWAGKDFRISLHQGTATVSGTVPSQEAKQRVLRIVRRSPGVFEVNDELRIQEKPATTTPAVDDRELSRRTAEQIATRIPGAKAGEDWWFTGWRVEGLDNAWNIVVEADEGDVTLEGEVPRFGIARQAIEAALVVPGVHSVRSEMEIEPDYYRYGYPYAPYPPSPAFSPYGAYPYAAVPGHGPYGDPWGAFDRDHHDVPDGTGRAGQADRATAPPTASPRTGDDAAGDQRSQSAPSPSGERR